MPNVYVCLPVYVVIDVANPAEGQQAKQSAEQLLASEMVKYALGQSGLRVHQISVGDPYPCQAPTQQTG
jgi:hypothetical protein